MIQFDTLDKKPKVYSTAILTVCTAVLIAFLIMTGICRSAAPISLIIDIYMAVLCILLFRAFLQQLRYNPYSYNTIYYIGFSLFFAVTTVVNILYTIRFFENPEENAVLSLLGMLGSSAELYMYLTFPLIVLFCTALVISNIVLLRREGRSLTNVLGIILSVLLVAGTVFLYRVNYYVFGSTLFVAVYSAATNIFAAVYLYFECMMIGTMIADAVAVRYVPPYDRDFVIILGCGLRSDGTPTPLLQGRIDRALEFYRKQKETTGKELTFVTSGGQGADEVNSESLAMKRYLMEQGIPEERIIEEDRSTDTMENMRFSKEKIREVSEDGKIAFSTTNYHVFRSGIFARRVKMRAIGMGAKTRWYFWPNAAVREFVGLLTEHKGKQALILGSMVLFYVLTAFLGIMLH